MFRQRGWSHTANSFFEGGFSVSLCTVFNTFICHPSDFTVSEVARIEPRTVQTFKKFNFDSKLHPWLIFGQIAHLKAFYNRLKYWKSNLNKFFFWIAIPVSPICGVVDSPTQQYAESSTLRIGDTRSWRLSDSTIGGVGDSPYHWCGESTTLHIINTESFLLKKFHSRLSVSVMRRVVFRIWISPQIRSQNQNGPKGSVRDSWGANFCKNPRKSASLPCPF